MGLILILLACITGLLFMLFFLPISGTSGIKYIPPEKRFHEADAVLSIRLLEGSFASANANFRLIESLSGLTHGKTGRGPRSGERIKREHDQAIVLTVEMGFSATAHIDGHYDVICPLVAVDAGLGMIGRMGLMMTPRLGPRVRISVVTTDLPLKTSRVKHDLSMLDYCNRCRKCATVCPAGAIPNDDRQMAGCSLRWKIDSEKCYHFWTVAGTDCGRCLAVCPYSHQNNLIHNFIRWGIKNNLLFRLLALKLDDVFYGKQPSVRPMPGWMN